MILEEVRGNPPDVTLGHIVKDLLLFFNGFECLHEAKRMIEKQCGIKKEPEHKCWPEDDVKRAWKETNNLNIKSSKRRHWARVIILQVVKCLVCDMCKQNAAQKNSNTTTDEHVCEMTPNSEDRSSQSKAELETAGAAGGVNQMLGVGKKVSKVSKLREDSGAASEGELSPFSTDEAPSPAEVNSNNGETRNAALDTLVNNCEQQKYIDSYDMHDKENVRRKNGLQSTCGKSQRMKGNPEGRSSQNNAEPQQTDQTKETAEQQSGADSSATKRKCTDNTGSESLLSTSGERDDSNEVPKRRSLTRGDDGSWKREGTDKSNSQTVYIRIPFSVMSGNESTSRPEGVPNNNPTYKLIDGVPNLTEIRKRKSYAMLYDNRTRNAAWVYEILNSETLKQKVEMENYFSVDRSIHPFYQASANSYGSTYVRGHLAAVANHRWCQEACEDTFLMSNISPQCKELNSGMWKTLENSCREIIRKHINEIRNVHVYSGPLYLPTEDKMNLKIIGGKTVPTHFFKVIIEEHEDKTVNLECYAMPNAERLNQRKVSIEDIERASGLIFRESSCSEGETDSLRTMTWTGENIYKEPFTVISHVNISTPNTNVNTGLQ